MISSMTGFGAGRSRSAGEEVSVEIRSVNHKYCEVKARLPSDLMSFEVDLVRQIKDALRRGALDVTVRRSPVGQSSVTARVDLELAREYVAAMRHAAEQLGLEPQITVTDLAQVDGVVNLEARALDTQAAGDALRKAAEQAIAALIAMRRREGEALAQDLLARIAVLREAAAKVAQLSPATVEQYRARLQERIAELSRGIQVDPQRIAQEVALFADRVDVAEELTRLASHLDQLEQLVRGEEPAGRKMDFLVQEIHREVNTTGSKSQSAELAQVVVGMKAEIERIREQVQNVE